MGKQKNTISEVGSSIELTFTESQNSPFPIAKTGWGKICLIEFKSKNARVVKAGETWECLIVSEDQRKMIVNPVALMRSKEHNALEFNEKLSDLQKKFQS
jgi:hypothetical protein